MRSWRSGSLGGDDFGEGGDVPATGDFEAGAEIVPEFDSELAAGLVEAEGRRRGSRGRRRRGFLRWILRLVTWQRTSFSEPLVCSGISGLSSTLSNSLLLVRWRVSRRSRVAKPVLWPKMRSNRADKTALRSGEGWRRAGLQVGVEEPDQAADASLGGALERR